MDLNKFEPEVQKYKTPLLFLHGMWHASWCWEEFIEYFTDAGFTCYTFDLREHGKERFPKGIRWKSISNYVEDLESAVQLIGNPVVIGHSMGGLILQKFLERHDPPAAILVAPSPHYGNILATFKFMAHYPLQFLRIIGTFNMKAMITSKDRYARMFLTEGTDIDSNFEKVQNEAFRAYLDTVIFNLPKVGKIKKTVSDPDNLLLVAGEKDSFFSPKTLEKTAAKYGAHFKVFKGLGHNMMVGPGSDDVASYCVDFLSTRIS